MTSYFEFETIPEINEFAAREAEFGMGQTEWEFEYARRRSGPTKAPMRFVRRPKRRPQIKGALPSWQQPTFVRRRWPAYGGVPLSFPVIPWRGWASGDVPPDVPQDEPPTAPTTDAPVADDQQATAEPDASDAQAVAPPSTDLELFEFEFRPGRDRLRTPVRIRW